MLSIHRLPHSVGVLAFFAAGTGPSWAAQGGENGREPEPLRIDKPLIAAWGFDEAFGGTCRDASGNGCDASLERTSPAAMERVGGLFGKAIRLSGSHVLRVPERSAFGTLAKISFSVWAAPSDLSGYRELFRKEDGENRILFSFQGDGKILSLGLNVGGYVECNAGIDPTRVLDGGWHHCAATFDGRFMRVYLDGKEVGSLKRPGTITSGGTAPGCIGSSNGGECFQGLMDDLRIWADALTSDEIGRIYRDGTAAIERISRDIPGNEPKVAKPLLAHWTFNEQGATRILRDVTKPTASAAQTDRFIPRTRGVHGNALDLRGEHRLEVRGIVPRQLAKVTFSAWTRPTDIGGFREIFRQEAGDHRLLFSFQESGTVLSLGLNVGGYLECDASINRANVVDGGWHHCAAAFDGEFMRVYLDGKEAGSLKRPGKIAVLSDVPAFIGSSGGASEFFQGSLDDLRIYSDALTGEEIAFLYRSGLQSLERFAQELEKVAQTIYVPGKTFAETLVGTRKNIVLKGCKFDRDLAGVMMTRLRKSFPKDCEDFTTWTGTNPLDYLVSEDGDVLIRTADRLVGLVLEYKPLTEQQWQKQTSAELQKWQEADAIAGRFHDLKGRGDAARFSPEWIDLCLDAGRRIQFRPVVHEPVAPYVPPSTPITRNLSHEEAREALKRDWLHQADGNPTSERIAREIGWARQLAERIASGRPGEVDFSDELSALAEVADRTAVSSRRLTPSGTAGLGAVGPTASQPSAETLADDLEIYFQVREIKRRIMFRNPAVDFDKVLFVDMPFPQGSEWPHETRHRLGYMAVPGGRLLILDGLSPEGKLSQLMPQAPLHGTFWRPDLSFDGKKVLFCFKPHNEKSFHLYEMNVDGTGLVQLTDGPYDDLDPIYLPDGHIVFTTTRAHTYVRCMPPTNAYVLARCDRGGRNIYLITTNNEPEYTPSVMNDGRLLYTRWEYTDKPLWRAQKLWTANPDGTGVYMFWGNQSVWPDLMKDARSIPGSSRVMFTGSAHHNWFSGSVGIIDPHRGYNFPHGLTKVTADVPWPECGNGPVDPVESPNYHRSGDYPAYYSPYPLSEQDFLVSAQRGGKFLLYLMDVDGNRELIYEGVNNIFHAMPLKPRPRPPVIPDRVVWPRREDRLSPKNGIIYSANVYYGAPEELKGMARYLRVLHIEPKTYTYWYKRPYISTGPVVSAVQSEGVKRVLGTVPIEADGSVAFFAPPGMSLHFQLLDENYRALQTMRSFTGVMPGESRGCLGCHELHSRTPQLAARGIAMTSEPRRITPPPWGQDTVSYGRYVQPVLDKYCGKCHQGQGEARKTLDLTERPGFLDFTEPYLTLIGRPTWGAPYVRPPTPPPGWGIADMLMVEAYGTVDPAAYRTPKPMQYLSYRSRLIEQASSGKHHGVKVDFVSLQRLIAWVDAMCPFLGDEEIREMPDPVFQGVDWLAVRPRIATAPRVVRPGPVDGR